MKKRPHQHEIIDCQNVKLLEKIFCISVILGLILFHKVTHKSENGFITVEAHSLVGIEDGMVILEGITILVFQEDAWDMTRGKWIMVAVCSQFSSVQGLKVMLALIDLLKERETTHPLITHLTVLDGVVVTYHIYIEQILDLLEGQNGMVGIPSGAAQVGILA